ncbi:MAG TPA: permease-like cell division protein FtsX [Candidatus Saccharibacteria bacterium]|nr:permease-like cell division protein FtsX [Candidatus Saccharibacteria bacterium]
MARKLDAKAFAQQKRKRRQWLTFIRMCRYGVNNFSRNAWLTIAATAVMTITLLIVFATLAARSTLVTTVEDIRDKVDMSIYLKTDVEDGAVETIRSDLKQLSSVTDVSYVSPEEARADFAKQNGKNADTLSALNEAVNKFPGTIRVSLVDINDTKQLDNFVKNNETLKANIDPDRKPSFAGERRTAIQNIARTVTFADRAGLIGSIVFIAISSLIVFNTIRMAIFNRKDEIEMMKLIGADKSFIRGPFIVEAIVYGFIAAIIATGLGMLGLFSARSKLLDYGIAIGPTIDYAVAYIGFILLGMILLGAIIGVVSSLLATRRYLKI